MNSIKLSHILNRLANNEQLALEELFNHFYPRLFNFSKTFLKLEDGIDDVLQEVFVKIWRKRHEINHPETFNSYLFTITRNLVLNELRSRLNDRKMREKILQKSVAPEYLLTEEYDYQELKKMVDDAIGLLPQRQHEIFTLSRTQGLSHREIAQKLDICEKTVEYHIHQAIQFIKGKLKAAGLISLLYFSMFF